MDINQNHSGIGNNIINVGAQGRHLTNEEDKKALLKNLLDDKNKKIEIISVFNDSEAFNLAHEIFDFLKESGYEVKGVTQVAYNRPVGPLTIQRYTGNNEKIDIIIGQKG